jgi:hypothetical protein
MDLGVAVTAASPGDTGTPSDRVDTLCDRFEDAWKAGQRPRLEDYLDEVHDASLSELLHDLFALELAYRARGSIACQRAARVARLRANQCPCSSPEAPKSR